MGVVPGWLAYVLLLAVGAAAFGGLTMCTLAAFFVPPSESWIALGYLWVFSLPVVPVAAALGGLTHRRYLALQSEAARAVMFISLVVLICLGSWGTLLLFGLGLSHVA